MLVFRVRKRRFLTLIRVNRTLMIGICCLAWIGRASLETSRAVCASLFIFDVLVIAHELLGDQRIRIDFTVPEVVVLARFARIRLLLSFHNVVVMEPLGTSFTLVQIIENILAIVEIHQVGSCRSLIAHRVEVLTSSRILIGVLGRSAGNLLGSRLTPLPRIHLRPSARNGHRCCILILLCRGRLARGGCSVINDVDLVAHHD